MKKTILGLVMILLLSGCGMWNRSGNNKGTAKNLPAENERYPKESAYTNADMMNYLRENGVTYTGDEKINSMDFSAHEGTSFMMNDSKVFLYRLKGNEEQMGNLLKDAKMKKKVKVKENGQEKEYGAMVNGDYLLIYDEKADMKELKNMFSKFNTTNNGI